jgi:subfamily B ATP-binding cassette protein MsbA
MKRYSEGTAHPQHLTISPMQSNSNSTRQLLFRSLEYIKPYWRTQLLSLFVAITLAAVSLVNPWIYKLLIDDVFSSGDTSKLKIVCFLLIISYLFQSGFSILQSYLYAKAGGKAVRDLSQDFYDHIQILSYPYMQKTKLGSILARFTSDIPALQQLYTSTLVSLVRDSLRFIAVLIVMLLINTSLTVIILICLPFYAFLMKSVSKPIRQASKRLQDSFSDTIVDLNEKLSGIREIAAFSQEEIQSKTTKETFNALLKSKINLSIINSLTVTSALISAVGLLLVIWFGGNNVIQGSMQVGMLIAYLGYASRLFGPINTLISTNSKVQSAMGAARRIFRVLDTPPSIQSPLESRNIVSLKNVIEYKDVSFSYSNQNRRILKDINLEIQPGESVALVGSSGSGKTTLVMLLLRFYDPNSGSILVGNHDLRTVDLKRYRQRIGVVFQDAFLFNRSVKENIAFGKIDSSFEEIKQAAKLANAMEFISGLKDGFDTIIGDRGSSLSGGQRQRIAIARAFLRNPEVVVLDEATSALDVESEIVVQDAMRNLLRNRTDIIIAHRVTTVMNADRIVVLEEGRIVEEGSYNALLSRESRFRELQGTIISDLINEK